MFRVLLSNCFRAWCWWTWCWLRPGECFGAPIGGVQQPVVTTFQNSSKEVPVVTHHKATDNDEQTIYSKITPTRAFLSVWGPKSNFVQSSGSSTFATDISRNPVRILLADSTPAAALLRRPNTGGGETTVQADGCRAEVLPWKTREVESNTLTLSHLHPATNYMVRAGHPALSVAHDVLFFFISNLPMDGRSGMRRCGPER